MSDKAATKADLDQLIALNRDYIASVQRMDAQALGEAKYLFAISRNVAERLRRSTGFSAEPLLVPFPSEEMAAHITTTRVNNSRYNEPDAGAPVEVIQANA